MSQIKLQLLMKKKNKPPQVCMFFVLFYFVYLQFIH